MPQGTETDALDLTKIPPGTEIRDLPDEAFGELEVPGAEPPAEPTPSPEPKEEPKTEPEPAPEPEPKKPAEEEPFDPAAWAEAQGIPGHLVASCKTPLEAAAAVVRRLKHRERLDGQKDREIAELRERARQEPPKTDTYSAGKPQSAVEVTAEWTPEQREQFREWFEREPEKAYAWMVQQQLFPVVATLREEHRAATEELRQSVEAAKNAPREQELENEYTEFIAAHPEDFEAFMQEDMPVLAEAFGMPAHGRDGKPTDVGERLGAKLEDLYQLNQLRKTSPRTYGAVVRDMRCGMEFQRARRVAELEKAESQTKGASDRAKEQVKMAKGAAAATAGAGPVSVPTEPIYDLKELTDDQIRDL